jgi:hypothetical protein
MHLMIYIVFEKEFLFLCMRTYLLFFDFNQITYHVIGEKISIINFIYKAYKKKSQIIIIKNQDKYLVYSLVID